MLWHGGRLVSLALEHDIGMDTSCAVIVEPYILLIDGFFSFESSDICCKVHMESRSLEAKQNICMDRIVSAYAVVKRWNPTQ